jgi:predicted dehydrogenase
VKIGLIGRGRWGQVWLRTLQAQGMRPVWVCGKDDIRFDADAVIIATPAHTHYDLARRAFRAGCHVLLEKPMSLSFVEATRIRNIAVASGRIGFVANTHTFSMQWRRWRYMLRYAQDLTVTLGGPTPAPKWWCKGWHGVSLALDFYQAQPTHWLHHTDHTELWFGNRRARVYVHDAPHPVTVDAYVDQVATYTPVREEPQPMEVMLAEFNTACRTGHCQFSTFEHGYDIAAVLEGR